MGLEGFWGQERLELPAGVWEGLESLAEDQENKKICLCAVKADSQMWFHPFTGLREEGTLVV